MKFLQRLPRLLFRPACGTPLHISRTAIRHSSSSSSSAPQKTFYTLFPRSIPCGAPPRGPFDIDLRALQREFFTLQQISHPDVSSRQSPAAADDVDSSYINHAYSTLRDPLSRAVYLLSLHGMDVAEDTGMGMDDKELLMEVLEAHEVIEEARKREDLEVLEREAKDRVLESEKAVGEACESGDWEAARKEAVRLRYRRNVKEAVAAWEEGKPVVLMH